MSFVDEIRHEIRHHLAQIEHTKEQARARQRNHILFVDPEQYDEIRTAVHQEFPDLEVSPSQVLRYMGTDAILVARDPKLNQPSMVGPSFWDQMKR
jgi:hypothetical protein